MPVEQFWHRVPGGTARATRETLNALADLDDVSTVPLAAWHRRSLRSVVEAELVAGVEPIAYLPMPRPLLYESWLRLDRPGVSRSVGPFDVAWASSMIPLPTSGPQVATIHDLDFLDNPQHGSRRGRSFFPRAFAATVDRADLIVCPSQVVADDCVRHGIEASRIRVVWWGVREPICPKPAAAIICRSFGLPERFLLWVGTMEPRKNLHRLVEAMAMLDGPPLAVVGPPGWNLDGEDVLAPLGDRVHRLGLVDEMELSALYRGASAFVYPSLAEGFGLPVLEAMIHGTPVITSAGTATEEVAGGAAELVDPKDPESIAAGTDLVLAENGSTMRNRIDRGLRRSHHMSWSATARGYRDVFVEAVSNW